MREGIQCVGLKAADPVIVQLWDHLSQISKLTFH